MVPTFGFCFLVPLVSELYIWLAGHGAVYLKDCSRFPCITFSCLSLCPADGIGFPGFSTAHATYTSVIRIGSPIYSFVVDSLKWIHFFSRKKLYVFLTIGLLAPSPVTDSVDFYSHVLEVPLIHKDRLLPFYSEFRGKEEALSLSFLCAEVLPAWWVFPAEKKCIVFPLWSGSCLIKPCTCSYIGLSSSLSLLFVCSSSLLIVGAGALWL